MELIAVDPLYRLQWPDGDRFDYCSDGAALEAEIARRNPADAAGYRRFHDYAGAVFKAGYEELAATPFLRFWDMVRVAPRNWPRCVPTARCITPWPTSFATNGCARRSASTPSW